MRISESSKSKLFKIVAVAAGLGLTGLTYPAYKWNQNRVHVLNMTEAWKQYSDENQIPESNSPITADYADELIMKTYQKVKSRVIEPGKLELWNITPEEYDLDKAGIILINNYNLSVGAKNILLLAKELTNRKPITNEEGMIKQIYDDAKILRNDKRANEILSKDYGDISKVPIVIYTLAATIMRTNELIRKQVKAEYNVKVDSGLMLDNHGYSRKVRFHDWVEIDGKKIDIGPKNIQSNDYITFVENVMNLRLGYSDAEKDATLTNVSERRTLKIKPKN